MNQFSLTFVQKHLEIQFEEYWVEKGTKNIMFIVKANLFFSAGCSIIEFIQGRIFMASFILLFSLLMIILYVGTVKQLYHIKYMFSIYTISGIIIPYISLTSILTNNGSDNNETLALTICAIYATKYLQVEKNFLIHVILHLNSISVSAHVIAKLYGWNLYLAIFCIYSLFQLMLDYNNLRDQRLLFKESLCNQSISDILDRVVEDKIRVFNYNEDLLQFKHELLNESFRNEFEINSENQSSINCILTDMHVYYDSKVHSLSEYLYQLSKCVNTYSDITLYRSAFYKQKQNKYQLEVHLQEKHKFKFIVKVQKFDQVKSQNKRQIEFLKFYQIQTTKTMNKIQKIVHEGRIDQNTMMFIQTILNDYHLKIQISNLKILNNYIITPSVFNIITLLKNTLRINSIQYQLEASQQIDIQTDLQIFQIILATLTRYIKLTSPLLDRVAISIYTDNSFTHFSFQIIRLANKMAEKQILKFIQIAAGYIGIPESVRVTQFLVQFTLYNCLESRCNQIE